VARLFVAVRPPPVVLDQLDALPRPAGPGVRWVPPAQWHVTVRFLGEADEEPVAAALERASLVLTGRSAPVATLGPRVSRLGRQVICVPVGGLSALAEVVNGATTGLGAAADPGPFRGHLTLGRLKHRGACGLAGHPVEARFAVTELELVRSVLGHDGARHEVVRTVRVGT
jgi:2'-5' RNA ligase